MPEQSIVDTESVADVNRKSQSSKRFLMGSVARVSIGLGVIGLLGLALWLGRIPLAEAGLNGFLRSKGIPADVTIENLQFDTAIIRDLQLGSQAMPNLTARNIIIKWRVDSKAQMVFIERLDSDGAMLHIAVDKDGKPDFGALAPLLKPSDGPKRSIVTDVRLTNATVIVDTVEGQGRARLDAWGGEGVGWTGRGDITPPAKFFTKVLPAGQSFAPIRLGFALRQLPTTDASKDTSTILGFSVLPKGQSLRYLGYDVLGIAGDITGQVQLRGGGFRIDTRPTTLAVKRITGETIDIRDLDMATSPVFWNQAGSWQTNSQGSFTVTGGYSSLRLVDARLSSGPTRFGLGAARADSGRMQLEYQSDIQRLAGPITARRLVFAGTAATSLADMAQLGNGTFVGKGQISGSGIVVPADFRSRLPKTLPPAVQNAITGAFSSSGAYDYRISPTASQIRLLGPLSVRGASGLRASLVPNARGAPTLSIANKPNGTFAISGLASGRTIFDLPALGRVQGNIEGATFGPRGWALVSSDLTLSSPALLPSVLSNLRFRQLTLEGDPSGKLKGHGIGQVAISAPGSSRALLGFDLRGTPATVSGTIVGPVEGFGSALGLGGYGISRGTANISGNASRNGNNWAIDARGQLRGTTLTFATVSATNPTLQWNAKSNLNAKTLQGSISGNLVGELGTGASAGTQVGDARSSLQFAGIISPSRAQLRGTGSLNLSSLRRASTGSSGQVSVSGLRAAGPFTVSSNESRSGTGFWNGALVLSSDLSLGADRVQSGNTQVSRARVLAPISASISQGNGWRTQGRLQGQAGQILFANASTSDVRLEGPFSATSTPTGWRGQSAFNLAAQTLNSGDTRLNGLTARTELGIVSAQNGNLSVTSPNCLFFNAQSGRFPGDARVNAASGKLCPNANGQLAVISANGPRLFATTSLAPFTITMGGPTADQSIDIGEVNGTITTKPNGTLGLNLFASQFGLNFKMPDGTTAIIKANEAALDIVPKAAGIGLQGRLGRLSSIGLPVLLSGGATADMTAGADALSGRFNFDDIIIKDIEKSVRYGEARLVGGGTLAGNQVTIIADVLEPASNIKMANLTLTHNIASGAGSLDVQAKDLLMSPEPVRGRPGLDIVTLIPPLRGVVSDMVGVANASATVAWARTTPLVSSAKIDTRGLDFSTMLGPITGLSGEINLDDLLLVRTPGQQTIKVGSFDPGLPIENGTVNFSLPGNNSLQLEDASWPFAEGKLSVRPATWAFRDGDQVFAIDVENVDLAKLLRLTDVPNLEIDGKVSGVFPIEVRNGNVEIVGGKLRAREGGGVIRYTGPGASPPPPPPRGVFARIRQRLFGKPAPAGADLAINALRALEYKILEITVDGRITGELQVGVVLEGANQQVLSGQPFKFNIRMNVPVGQLLENLNRLNNAGSSPEVLKEIDRVMREERATTPPAVPAVPVP